MRVLIVEDERKLAQVLAASLEAEHYDVVVAPTGEDGFYRLNAEQFDLVVLDLMLPGRSGLEILQTLRQRRVDTPVLSLTARDGIEDRVTGLDLGADDYLVKIDRLTRLVDTLLRLSRGDAGTVKLTREAVDLADLARDVTSSLQVLAEERGQTLHVEAGGDASVSADRLVLRDAVTNLVDNAIKYGPGGSTITLRVGAADSHATLSVADQGPGIAAEHRERIFDRFYRIDEGRARERGGTGLGLAIAKWAVAANSGRLELQGDGPGSVFTITLPLGNSRQES